MKDDALAHMLDIPHVEPYQLGAPQSASEANQ
jgi:hypothetical protein